VTALPQAPVRPAAEAVDRSARPSPPPDTPASPPSGLCVAYLVNLYPAVSHTFIRREILALERAGVRVERIALHGWDGDLADEQDRRERERTRYVLRGGAWRLLLDVGATLLRSPRRFARAAALAWRIGRDAFRPLPYHLVFLAEACRIARWVRDGGVQHVHAHFGSNPAELAMLVHALGGPGYSFTVHGPTEFDMPARHKLREKSRDAAFVVAISSYGRSQLYRWLDHRDWPKVRVVHCGVEQAFHASERSDPPAAPRLVCVGRLCAAKGQLLLVEAVARVVRDGIGLDLVLAGDGEMRSQIEARVRELGIEKHVHITGWLSSDEVRREILAARALALPSFAEGLPVVIMEAMALGRPILSTYVAGIPELVEHDRSGWLFPAGDIDAAVAAIRCALAATPQTLAQMGAAARSRVLARHDVDTEVDKLLGHIREALEPSAAPLTGR